ASRLRLRRRLLVPENREPAPRLRLPLPRPIGGRMKLTLANTDRIVHVNGVPARIWEGTTESGIPVIAFVTRLAVKAESTPPEFERELAETRVPSPEAMTFPARMIL